MDATASGAERPTSVDVLDDCGDERLCGASGKPRAVGHGWLLGRPVATALEACPTFVDAGQLLVHPDVRRMLLTIRAWNEAARAFALMRGVAPEGTFAAPLAAAIERLERVTHELLERAAQDPALPGAVSVDYLDLFALTAYAWLWARMADVAPADEFGDSKRLTAAFFARLLPRAAALEMSIGATSAAVMELPADWF